MYHYLLTSIIFLAVSLNATGQVDANELTARLAQKLQQVKQYEADILISVDVEYIKIREREATISYQYPDSFDLKTEGFALLPKNGTNMDYLGLFRKEYTALYEKEEVLEGRKVTVVKVIPMNTESTDIVLAQLWIEPQSLRIFRLKTFTRDAGSYTADFSFSDHPYDLPATATIRFELKSMMIPASMTGDLEAFGEELDEGPIQGIVRIDYRKYRVNR